MDNLADILHLKDFDQPPEIIAIKEYVRDHYKKDISVTIDKQQIVISSSSAGLIGSLRLNSAALQKKAGTNKRILFRIRG